MEVITSAPMTSTFRCAPDSTNWAPTVRAYAKPEQAALMSKPQAFVAPSWSCTRQAVAGKGMSGVTVATMMRSTSAGLTLARSRHSRAARVARALVPVPGSTTWRCRIPVRVRIHSSEVSTTFARSALVITRSGT